MHDMRRSRSPIHTLAIALLVAAACSSGCPEAENEDPTTDETLFGTRYCEVFLIEVDGDDSTIEVYNTVGLNLCPPELWEALDTDDIAQDHGATLAMLNGPRFWTIDGAGAGEMASGESLEIGGIEMHKVAEIHLTLAEMLALQSESEPYVEVTVVRDNSWTFRAGREVYELVDPDGETYIMQSYSHQVDDTLTTADLPLLGERLQLPDGWSFQARTTDSELTVQATGEATMIQDELSSSFQKY